MLELCLVLAFFQTPAWACSAFQLKGPEALVGKSYDWSQTHGQLATNARNLKKSSLLISSGDRAETWTSKYGSLTFSQHGKEFPLGGMNEKGVVVEVLWLNSTEYPDPDRRPTVNELQWIQYQLDNFSTVKEIVAELKNRRINALFADVHYLVCDSSECAAIEFLKKTEAPSSGAAMVANALTNNTYSSSVSYLKKFSGFGGTNPLPTSSGSSSSSLDRFVRLAMQNQVPKGTSAEDHAFDLLDSVEQPGFTQWQIVYDPKGQKVAFRVPKGDIKTVDLSAFDFSCKSKKLGQWLDFSTVKKGDVSSGFADYDAAINRKLVETGSEIIKGLIPSVFPANTVDVLAKYPEAGNCTE